MSTDRAPQTGNPMGDADERAKSQAEGADKRDDGFTRMLLVADVRQQEGTGNFETRRMAIATIADINALDPTWMPDEQHQAWWQACQEATVTGASFTSVCGLPVRDVESGIRPRPIVMDWAMRIEACLQRNEQPPKCKGPWNGETVGTAYEALRRERYEVDQDVVDYTIESGHIYDPCERKIRDRANDLINELVDESTAAMILADVMRAGGPSKDRGWTL